MATHDRKKRNGNGPRWLLLVLILAGLLAWLGWYKLLREVPQQLQNDSMEEYYKYGSIGTEDEQGIPFWLWLVLPKMFPEYLPGPGGWASIGLAWEQGRELPVGISRKTIGFERVAINCAFCHLSTLRDNPLSAPQVFPGGAGTTVNSLAYQRFLFSAASDPRFTADNILDAIGQVTDMSLLDRLLYRFILVPATRKALLEQKQAYAWTDTRPDWGRGRIDPFNPVKVSTLGLSPGDTTGNSDMQPIWNLRPRVEGHMALHWDGLNTDLTEVILSSAIGDGTSPKALPIEKLKALQEWLLDLQPPRFADHFTVDQALADRGKPLFDQYCSRCHAIDGEQTGQVLTLTAEDWAYPGTWTGALFTDPNRAQMWTPEAADAYNAYADAYPWDFKHFRSTGGYVNVPLDGIWIRAPYLHNGSVPYLDELLQTPDQRSKVFHRGLDVYDPQRMGFVTQGEDVQRVGTLLDTSLRGNSNQGHLWGTELSTREKQALLEYLKTL